MEDKSAPQEGPREGAAPASPGAGPNSPLQAANKRDATPKADGDVAALEGIVGANFVTGSSSGSTSPSHRPFPRPIG